MFETDMPLGRSNNHDRFVSSNKKQMRTKIHQILHLYLSSIRQAHALSYFYHPLQLAAHAGISTFLPVASRLNRNPLRYLDFFVVSRIAQNTGNKILSRFVQKGTRWC